ncbi:ketopantoate reductase family protein [Bosea minatitlanensis]|uniref:2-dehydropantoate 2-reductase n=1 Tax=Bosea minatitlanensis TaxID=128782 RepID=A0ABW0F5G8_9HYPH|nr:2-dehydropantoate 2-reductase N-terminal domain-containing protein [Bosea minatitlanensis]MCT4493424.1 ketopantoate reductase family protein [Bosea minatitlanensis]
MSEPILIWGAGAIGATFGAALKRAGRDVTFVDLVEDHVAAIRDPARGLRITGPVDPMTVVAPAFIPAGLSGRWRRIYLAVKAHHTEEAARALAPHLADDGHVVSLQNGLCESLIAGVVGAERTVGAFINFGADWIGPGEVHYGNRAAFVVGEVDGRITPRLEEILAEAKLFEPDAILTEDIGSYLWGKLAYGSLLFAQGVGELGIADCLARPELLPLWRGLATEVLAVAKAEGVTARGFNGFDPAAFQADSTEEAARRSVAAMVAFNRPNAKTHSGIWRDLAIRKRRTEVDAQLAPIVALGAKHGIACPKLTALVETIHAIEDGKRPMSDANLDEMVRA